MIISVHAIQNKDVQMINLLIVHPSFVHLLHTKERYLKPLFQEPHLDSSNPTIKRNSNRIVCVLKKVIKEAENFFNNPLLSNFLQMVTYSNLITKDGFPHNETEMKTFVIIASLFSLVEEDKSEEAIKILNSLGKNSEILKKIKSTYVCSPFKIKVHSVTSSAEKSLVMFYSENSNLKLFQLLKEKGFDISDLGEISQYMRPAKEKNNMILWYTLFKYLMDIGHKKFVHQITRFEEIMNGPEVMGALVTAAKQITPDIPFLQKIKDNFGSEWFINGKLLNMTAHVCLLRHGLNTEATLLMAYLGPNSESNSSRDEISDLLRDHNSFEKFKYLIEENPDLLTKSFTGNTSIVFHCMNPSYFSESKFRFLIENGADLMMESTKRENFLENHLSTCYALYFYNHI